KDVDFTKSLIVYQELVRELRAPGVGTGGLRTLLLAMVEKLRQSAPPETGERLLEAWINGLQGADFELESFRRAVYRALRAHLQEDAAVFEACLRWLEGGGSDRSLAKKTDLPVMTQAEENLDARRWGRAGVQVVRPSLCVV